MTPGLPHCKAGRRQLEYASTIIGWLDGIDEALLLLNQGRNKGTEDHSVPPVERSSNHTHDRCIGRKSIATSAC
jgi:hypothetical protein